MAGHSKWNNIKRKKGAADAQRGAIFTKIGREIHVAVRDGGPDPETNNRLKDAIAKAKASNVPNDNIERSIKKAAGNDEADNIEEITYEGYGPGGVAIMVRSLTDNRNRTGGDIRHIFDKFGGNLGAPGCVSFQFEERGVVIIERGDLEEEEVLMEALEAGAEDFAAEDEVFEVTTLPEAFDEVKQTLAQKEYPFLDTSLGPVPSSTVQLDENQAASLEKLLSRLEEHEDVQDVYHNWSQ